MTRTLDVWWDDRIVGQLTQDTHGALGFAYGPEWLRQEDAPALSVSLPRREEPFSRRECRPFFGGLLPEESQRDAVARVLGVSRANEFALLDRLGGDVATERDDARGRHGGGTDDFQTRIRCNPRWAHSCSARGAWIPVCAEIHGIS